MDVKRFSLKEQLRYSWLNVVLALVTVVVVLLVADGARADRATAECHTALMNDLHEELGQRIGPDDTLEGWDEAFNEWHHRLTEYRLGGSLAETPECRQ